MEPKITTVKTYTMKTSNEKLSEQVFGQTFTIPNLYYFFPDWNCDVNPHYEALCIWFEKYWLQRWVEDLEIQRALRKTCVPFFVSCIYPRIEYEQLKTMAGLFGWFFFWDDLIDCGPLTNDIQGTEILCADTIKLMKRCLGTTEPTKKPPPAVAPIQCFWDVGTSVWHGCSPDARARFLHECQVWVRVAEESQRERECFEVPTYRRYEERRQINIGCRVSSMFSESVPPSSTSSRTYNNDGNAEICMRLEYTIENVRQQELGNHLVSDGENGLVVCIARVPRPVATYLIMIYIRINDLISMKKEFIQHQFESIVPILMFHSDITSTEAVDEAGKMLTDSYDLFRQAESILYSECPLDCLGDIREFVHNCKDLVVATMHWSYECTRYMKSGDVDDEKKVTFTVMDRV